MLKFVTSALSMTLNGVVAIGLISYSYSATAAKGETAIVTPEVVQALVESVIENEQTPTIYPNLIDSPQAHCLALNVYYESRSDNLAGQYAVADVVLNRVRDARYPNTICDVVYQGKKKPSWKDPERMVMVRDACQFSWYCDGKPDNPGNETGWANAQYIAGSILFANKHRGITEGATHYHANYVNPYWSKDSSMSHIGRIGSHIFYRWD